MYLFNLDIYCHISLHESCDNLYFPQQYLMWPVNVHFWLNCPSYTECVCRSEFPQWVPVCKLSSSFCQNLWTNGFDFSILTFRKPWESTLWCYFLLLSPAWLVLTTDDDWFRAGHVRQAGPIRDLLRVHTGTTTRSITLALQWSQAIGMMWTWSLQGPVRHYI